MHKRRTSWTDLLRSVYTLRATFPHGSTSRLVPLSLSRLQTQPKRHEGSRGKAESSAASNCLARTFSTFFRDGFPFLERRGRVPVGAKAPPQHTRHLGSSEVVSPIRVVTHPPTQVAQSPCQPATTQHLPETHPAGTVLTPRPGALCPCSPAGGRFVMPTELSLPRPREPFTSSEQGRRRRQQGPNRETSFQEFTDAENVTER